MDKNKRMSVPRMTLNEVDSQKAMALMGRSYLTLTELIKALIRKEYEEVVRNNSTK